MTVPRSGPLLLAAALAAAGCGKDLNKRDPAPVLAFATFDSGVPGVRAATIPVPNDLALKAAPAQTGATRAALFQLIDLGGWPPDMTLWSPAPAIVVPVRTETFDPATGLYARAAPPAAFDAATLNAGTVALVKLDTAPPTVLPATALPYNPALGALLFRPVSGGAPVTVLPPGRYVFALRGGAGGVRTSDGVPLEADQAVALVAPNKDLSIRGNQPPSDLSAEQIAALEQLRGTLAVGMDWSRNDALGGAICQGALGVTAAQLPENRCWLPPIPTAPLNQPLPTPGITAAFAGVDLVFPHEEIASIQTFEVFAPRAALEEEVTP